MSNSNIIRDSSPRKYRDLKVEIITRVDQVDITPLVTEISIYEDLMDPFLKGDLTFADNSGLLTALPIIGQEEVHIEFVRAGVKVEKRFACTKVKNVEKLLGETAGVVMSLTSIKHLKNAVSQFSKSYSGLASDIIQTIHSDNFGEEIEIVSPSSTAHHVVFPFVKPYAAINMVLRKTFANDGSPYFLYENLFGEGPILKSLTEICKDDDVQELSKTLNRNRDTETGQGQRDMPLALGQLIDFKIVKNSDTLKMLSGGALTNNTLRINPTNNEYTEEMFFYEDQAPVDAPLDPFENYEIDNERLNSQLINPNVRVEMYNPWAYESEGVTALNTQDDSMALAKANSMLQRLNNGVRISAYADSLPEKYMVGKCVELNIPPNLPPLEGEVLTDELFSGRYIISRLRHYIKGEDYTMSMELVRDGLNKPKGNS